MQKHLQRLETANGKVHPGKTTRRTGSELLVIEPEFMEWSGQQELYPVVLESVGDWSVTTSVEPPEGFVSDHESLSEEVDSELEAVQFTITDIGSDWIPTGVTHHIRHGGRREVVLSRIGVKLTPELAQDKGLDPDGHVLDHQGRRRPEDRFDPRLGRPAEIVGWIEPSGVDPDWTVKVDIYETCETTLAITRGRGKVVREIFAGPIESGAYEWALDPELYEALISSPGHFLTLRVGRMVQQVKLK
jgi:hypothetical protein